MTDAELAEIMAMDALRDISRKVVLLNADATDIQNLKAVLALANSVPDLVNALREERQKLESTTEELEFRTQQNASLAEKLRQSGLQIDEMRKVAGLAVNWLHACAPLHARAPEIRDLADRLYEVAKVSEKRVCEHDFQVPFDGVEVKLYEVCQKCGERRS